MTHNYLAFDLGAESGRAILGKFDGERIALTLVHRFANVPVRLPDGLHWDVLRLWHEIKHGLSMAGQAGGDLLSVGLDSWGVDFAILDRDGALAGNPFHYRDNRTDGMLTQAFQRVPQEGIFRQTGVQFLQINSLYQLLAMVLSDSPLLDVAAILLTIPDLFNYWLTGCKVCEFTNATTTQCYDPRRGEWARSLLEDLGIPTYLFPRVVPPGTVLGDLSAAVAEETGIDPVPVVAPACHDTASAVAAVPATERDFVYISSGTWSLMGTELPEPVIDPQCLAFNFTNEGGVAGTFRFLKNIVGLWLVQECLRTWARQGESLSYEDLTRLATQAAPLRSIINPDHGEFLKPGNMPSRIQAFCQQTSQPVPQTKGEVLRCATESLALRYRWVLEKLEQILGRRLGPIHIVGGGSQNRLLNQLTADATGRQVIAGPVEATSVGNIMVQAMALGQIASLEEGHQIVRRSFDLTIHEPAGGAEWDHAFGRFLALLEPHP